MFECLALFKGPRTVPEGMVKTWPVITQEDKDAVLSVFDSGQLHGTSAPQALALQKEWADYCGAKYCLVTNSGTAALHISLAAVGVGPGDEVILPAFTYWASAAAVLQHNAIPVFVDIEPKTFTIDPKLIESAITNKTKAIMPVDVHGMPADYDSILDIAASHRIPVVADSCQSHGSLYRSRRTGSIASITAFSTNRWKNLCSAEGGLVTTDRIDFYQAAKQMREFGEAVPPTGPRPYNALGLGWMYRSTEFSNAFCRSQLKHLDERNVLREELARFLTGQLVQIPGIEIPDYPTDRRTNYFNFVIGLRPERLGLAHVPIAVFKRAVLNAMEAEGVPLFQWQRKPVPAQDVFQKRIGYGKGCPWSCQHARQVEYKAENYPATLSFIDSHTYIGGVFPPNTIELMRLYVEAFRKVFGVLEEWSKTNLDFGSVLGHFAEKS